MLKQRTLLRYLDQVRTGGVKCIMLFSTEGVLLTHSGADSGKVKTAAAIVANVWNLYQKQLQSSESASFCYKQLAQACVYLIIMLNNLIYFGSFDEWNLHPCFMQPFVFVSFNHLISYEMDFFLHSTELRFRL